MSTKPATKKRAKKAAARPEHGDAVRISVILTKEQRQRLKVLAAERGVTISEVVREGIARFLRSDA